MRIAQKLWRSTRPKFTVGVVGVVFNAEQQVLLVEHVFHPQRPWGLPGGWVDAHESPSHAATREIQEEVQLTVEIHSLISVDPFEDIQHLDMAYLCNPTHGTQVGKLSPELLSYQWASLDQLPAINAFHRRAIEQGYKMMHGNEE
jgi:8-oxo-dGTP diphosphatase